MNHLALQDGFAELLLELAHFRGILLLLQEGYHEIDHIGGILVDDLDDHPAQNRVDMGVQVLQILHILGWPGRLDWLHEVLELEVLRKRTLRHDLVAFLHEL